MKLFSSCVITLFAALAVVLTQQASAQISGGVEGQPVIATAGATATSDAAYFDAYVGTGGASGGTDICTRISSAWNAVLTTTVTSAVIDARGFTGPWTCNNTSGPSPHPAARCRMGCSCLVTLISPPI